MYSYFYIIAITIAIRKKLYVSLFWPLTYPSTLRLNALENKKK